MKRLLLLGFSILIISCSPVKKYETSPSVLAWENDIQKFEELDKSETYSPEAVLFAGSSSIRLWSTLATDMAPYPVIQRGFGGSRLSDLVVYAERIFEPHPCNAIVLFVANDITGNDLDKSPEEVADLFKSVLKTIRKSHPVTPVYWIEVTPCSSRWKVWPEIKKSTELIRRVCENQKYTYSIRTDFAFLNSEGKPKDELFIKDLLHLNPDGYAVWTEIIKKEMRKLVPFPKTEIIAHRGASYLAPENSVASSKLAWELGADAVECDIHMSKDNRIIVNHDATTKRTSGKEYTIKNTHSDTLRKLDIGLLKDVKYKGEKIPFLEEIIQAVPAGKELVVEIKCGSEVLPELKKTINNFGKDKRFVFIGFDFQTISDTKKAFPENSCYWLCSNADLLKKNLPLVPQAGLEGISLSWNIITREVVNEAGRLKLEVFSWTVDNPAEAKRLISLGVKGITTNRPGWLNEQIGKD
ncbi:MAG: glycerophosphodiester phosphodiesterase family protein [Pedobacter sp.]|jgi:glycerophosphoryl diester phosphodiesterase